MFTKLPITEDHAPTIHLNVMVMHGIDDDNTVPVFRQGALTINVEPVHKRLAVTLKPSSENAQPGETVTIDIEALDPDGNPGSGRKSVFLLSN